MHTLTSCALAGGSGVQLLCASGPLVLAYEIDTGGGDGGAARASLVAQHAHAQYVTSLAALPHGRGYLSASVDGVLQHQHTAAADDDDDELQVSSSTPVSLPREEGHKTAYSVGYDEGLPVDIDKMPPPPALFGLALSPCGGSLYVLQRVAGHTRDATRVERGRLLLLALADAQPMLGSAWFGADGPSGVGAWRAAASSLAGVALAAHALDRDADLRALERSLVGAGGEEVQEEEERHERLRLLRSLSLECGKLADTPVAQPKQKHEVKVIDERPAVPRLTFNGGDAPEGSVPEAPPEETLQGGTPWTFHDGTPLVAPVGEVGGGLADDVHEEVAQRSGTALLRAQALSLMRATGAAEHAAAAAWLLALCVKAREGAAADAEAEAALRSYLAPRAAADAGGAAAAALAAVDALESGGLDAARRGVSALGARLGEKCEVCAAAVPMVATADPFSCAGPRRHPCDRCWLCFAHLPVKDRRCPLCGGGRCASCADDGGAGVLAAVPRGRCALCGVCVAATPRSLAFPHGPFC